MYAMRVTKTFKSKIGVFDSVITEDDYALLFAITKKEQMQTNGMYASAGISNVIKDETLMLLPYRNEAAYDMIRKIKMILPPLFWKVHKIQTTPK